MQHPRKVIIVPYDSEWPIFFESEAPLVKAALGDNCITIHHIGSTAIPGLAAKPVIDMVPVAKSIIAVDEVTEKMEQLGYKAMGENGILLRRFFQKENFHLHIFEQGNSEIERHLTFRDWMRTHPEDREAYEKLKKNLAGKYLDDRLSYCSGKDSFIRSIDEKTNL